MFLLIVLALAEFPCIATAILLQSHGEKYWYTALIPFWGYVLMQRKIGEFKVFTIPVRKYGLLTAELFVVLVLAYCYEQWGNANLPNMSKECLSQILMLPYVVCLVLMWASQLKAAMKCFRMMGVEKYALYSLCAATVIGTPIAMLLCRNRTIDYSISY